MDSIAAMFNFDMIGQLRDGRLDVLGIGSARDRQRVIDSTGILTGITLRRQVAMGIAGSGSGSDHMSFGLAGVPVLHFFARLHVAYHTRRDTVERLNLAGMLSVIDVTERLIRVVGDDVVGDDVATTMRRVQRQATDRGGSHLLNCFDHGNMTMYHGDHHVETQTRACSLTADARATFDSGEHIQSDLS